MKQVAATDGFNWGYDPLHWTTPEGSYATNPDGAARTREFRDMVAAINHDHLRLVMDVVYNHTTDAGQNGRNDLDRIVPGYYHRLNATRRRGNLHLLPQHRHRASDDGQAHGRLGADLGQASTRSTGSGST